MTDPLLLDRQQAAEALAISTDQLDDLTRDGEIPFIVIGRGKKRPRRRYHPADLAAFIEARRIRACPSTAAQARKTTRSTSGYRVVDFQAILARKRGATPSA